MALTLFRLQNACVGPSLGVVSILYHVVQCVRVKDTLNQGVNALSNLDAAFRHRHKDVVFFVGTVLVGHVILFINIVVFDEIVVDGTSLVVRNSNLVPIQHQRLPDEIIRGCLSRTLVKVVLNAFLQVGDKVLIPIGGNDRQLIHLQECFPNRPTILADQEIPEHKGL